MPKAATWTVRSPDSEQTTALAAALNVEEVTAACLVNRGISEAEQARAFFNPSLAELEVPDKMADLRRAATRTAELVMAGGKVAVFGDYDVDGISSAALVATFLEKVGANTVTMLADRFSGYGMGPKAIDYFVRQKCSLVIAVDCGTSDHEAAKRASDAELDLIVVDHHRIEGDFPSVFAFVNPEREDCGFKDKSLAAVGLAFYFVAAVRTVLCERSHIKRNDVDLRYWLDLVALGTVADVMPLLGNNRILVFHGLRQMSKMSREGLKSLIHTSKIRSFQMRADHISFQLAPRLNAAGRLSIPDEAFELLVADNRDQAEQLSYRLDRLSKERRVIEGKIIEAAKSEIEEKGTNNEKVLVVAGDGWHRGVLGIVAARLADWAGKPAFVIGFDSDEGIGSCRGRGQINLHTCLSQASQHLVRFGGHRDAAGFTVKRQDLASLKKAIIDYAETEWVDVGARDIVCDARLKASEITPDLLKEIGQLGPFGAGNPEPVFEVDGLYVLDSRVVGHTHLKLVLKTPTGSISAFGPRMGEFVDRIPNLVRVAAVITADEWRGDGTPELRLAAVPLPGQ